MYAVDISDYSALKAQKSAYRTLMSVRNTETPGALNGTEKYEFDLLS
jgi:hypothetical protein